MLKLTKKADYGLIAMRHLAEHADRGSCSAKDLADSYGIPQEALAKILQKLVRAKLLVSQHGIRGGYTLARDAQLISAFDVIMAVEGPLFMTSCVTVNGACEMVSRCTVKEPKRRVSQSIEEVLSRITIGEMARDRAQVKVAKREVSPELVTIEN